MKQYIRVIHTDMGKEMLYPIESYQYLKDKVNSDGTKKMLQFVSYILETDGKQTEFSTSPTDAEIAQYKSQINQLRANRNCGTCGK